MNKLSKNIFYLLEINLFLFLPHLIAFMGIAFNDTGETFKTFSESLPYVFKGIGALVFFSILLIIFFHKKKEDFSLLWCSIFQSIIIILWIIYYSNNLIK